MGQSPWFPFLKYPLPRIIAFRAGKKMTVQHSQAHMDCDRLHWGWLTVLVWSKKKDDLSWLIRRVSCRRGGKPHHCFVCPL